MNSTLGRISMIGAASLALLGLATLGGCISDDGDAEETGGSAGAGGGKASGGSGGSTGGSGGSAGQAPAGTKCSSPVVLAASKPGIVNFDDYDGSSSLTTWKTNLGGDSVAGILTGTFGYGDEDDGFPEKFAMVEGHDSTYALSISDTLADEYGGGMGLWISECLSATAFTGISFWVRGNGPEGNVKLSILMRETTSSTASTPDDAIGTCPGTDDTCIHPTYRFPLTDTWTEIKVPWTSFTAGDAAGTPVVPDGRNIWQIQFDVGLVWAPDANDVYQPTPAGYEFAADTFSFY